METKDPQVNTPKTPVAPVAPAAPTPAAKYPAVAATQRQAEALQAIADERAYQDLRWKAGESGLQTVGEFVLLLDTMVDTAKKNLMGQDVRKATELVLHDLRKIGATVVAAIELNGVRERAKVDVAKAAGTK